MSNAERIALTRMEEDGYDSFNNNHWSKPYQSTKVAVRGAIKIYKPKEDEYSVQS